MYMEMQPPMDMVMQPPMERKWMIETRHLKNGIKVQLFNCFEEKIKVNVKFSLRHYEKWKWLDSRIFEVEKNKKIDIMIADETFDIWRNDRLHIEVIKWDEQRESWNYEVWWV